MINDYSIKFNKGKLIEYEKPVLDKSKVRYTEKRLLSSNDKPKAKFFKTQELRDLVNEISNDYCFVYTGFNYKDRDEIVIQFDKILTDEEILQEQQDYEVNLQNYQKWLEDSEEVRKDKKIKNEESAKKRRLKQISNLEKKIEKLKKLEKVNM